MMGKIFRLTATLAFVSALVGLLLGIGYAVTQDYIAAARDQELHRAMRAVLQADEFRHAEGIEEGAVIAVYEGFSDGVKKGCVFIVQTRGYGGMIELMTGINVDGVVEGQWILQQQETPGLGSRAAEPPFRDQFRGRRSVRFTLGTDGENPIQAVTGATVTSNAVVRGVNEAVALYRQLQGDEPFEESAGDGLTDALRASLAADEYLPVTEFSAETPSGIRIKEVYEARTGGIPAGFLFRVESDGYYDLPIDFVVGIAEDGIVSGLKVLSQEETPGFGSRIAEDEFRNQFKGKKARSLTLVTDGAPGEDGIDSVSGASKSSGAVVSGVNEAISLFRKLRGEEADEPVEESAENGIKTALKGVLEAGDYLPVDFSAETPSGIVIRGVYEARTEGVHAGYVFHVDSDGFYRKPIEFVVGIAEDGIVSGLKVISQEETPGYGALVAESEFRNQFKGKKARPLTVVTEGVAGEDGIDSVSEATRSSSAVVAGVNEAIALFQSLRK